MTFFSSTLLPLRKSWKANSQTCGYPMPFGHHNFGDSIVHALRLYLEVTLQVFSTMPCLILTSIWSVRDQSSPLLSRARTMSRRAFGLVICLFLIQTQSILSVSQRWRCTGSQMPIVFMQGAQSQEYWQQALRVQAQSNGIRSFFCPSSSAGLLELMSTRRVLSPTFACPSTENSYFRKAFLVEPRSFSLKQTSAQVSMPWKMSLSLEQARSCWESGTVVVKETWQLDTHSMLRMQSLQKGSGMAPCCSRLRWTVEGTETGYSLLRTVAAGGGPSVTFIVHLRSSRFWKLPAQHSQSRPATSNKILIIIKFKYPAPAKPTQHSFPSFPRREGGGQFYWWAYNKMSSVEHLRRYKLLKSLDAVSKQHTRSEGKRKLSLNSISNISTSDNLRRLNKNKKYMLEEERNTEIERDNRLLYEKIMGHFQSLKDSIQSRHKWRKRKTRNQNNFDAASNASHTVNEQLKYLSRVQTRQPDPPPPTDPETLFSGTSAIDGVQLRVKVTLDRERYRLRAKNSELQISLEMAAQDYLRLHHRELQGNPCNIFKYLEIVGDKIRFRTQKPARSKLTKLDDSF